MSNFDTAACVGTHDILFITLDTLRYDVAVQALACGQTPALAVFLGEGGWQHRHSPASFTYAAHQAFFAGFLPTPAEPENNREHYRLFATRFPGSETTGPNTFVFDTADIITGFAGLGYHTLCVGGTGFFNRQSALGSVLPALFAESHWSPALGVAEHASPKNQIDEAIAGIGRCPGTRRLFLFINISACHPPHAMYLPGAIHDCAASQQAALAEVDRHLPRLFTAMQHRAPVLTVICSDHGTTFGEDGYRGHRIGHPAVWSVPYGEGVLPYRPDSCLEKSWILPDDCVD
ncbi:MAG: STM4013/SEN3800 family hydrolase [Parahaliea sp.]